MRYVAFGTMLRNIREKLDLSRIVFADAIGVSTSMLSLCENGKRRLNQDTLLKLVKIYSLPPDETNQLLVTAGCPPLSNAGLDIMQPSLIPLASYFSDNEIPDDQKNETSIILSKVTKIRNDDAKARELRFSRRWKEAKKVAQSTLSKVDDLAASLKLSVLNDSATSDYHHGFLDDATQGYHQALGLSRQIKNLVEEVNILLHLGDIERLRGYWHEAESLFSEAEKIANKHRTSLTGRKSLGQIYRKYAEIMIFRGNVSDAWPLLNDSLRIFIDLQDKYEEGKTHASIGWAYDLEGKWETALKSKRLGFQLSGQDLDDKYNIMKSHLYFGDSYLTGGKLEEAEENYQEALKKSEELDSILERSLIELGLANTYQSLGEFDKALQFYDNSIKYATFIQSPYRKARAQLGKGICLLQYGRNFEEAKTFLGNAKASFAKLDTDYYTILAKLSLFEYFQKVGNDREAGKLIGDIEFPSGTHFVLTKLDLAKAKAEARRQNPDEINIIESLLGAYSHAVQFNEYLLSVTHKDIMQLLEWIIQRKGSTLASLPIILRLRLLENEAIAEHKDILQAFSIFMPIEHA